MRLLISRASAEEALVLLVAEGYDLASWMQSDYAQKRERNEFDPVADNDQYADQVNQWGEKVRQTLVSIFPTTLEWGSFIHEQSAPSFMKAEDDIKWFSLLQRTRLLAKKLESIL